MARGKGRKTGYKTVTVTQVTGGRGLSLPGAMGVERKEIDYEIY